MRVKSLRVKMASLTWVPTAGAWPYRVLLSVISVYVVILGVFLRFKPHWMFRINKKVINGHEELTSCSSLMHSYLFRLLDVLYRQVKLGISHFGQWGVSNFVMASNHIVAAIRELGTQWHQREIPSLYLSDLSYQQKQASFALRQMSSAV